MRKTIIRLVTGLMLLALLFLCAGCENAPYGLNRSNPELITIWHYYNGAQKQAFDELIAEFNDTVGAQRGIAVEALSQGNVNELSEKVLDAVDKKVGASEVPDIFAAYADTAYDIYRRGMAADIARYMTDEERALYVPSYLEEGAFEEGALMIMPIAKSTEIFMLNATDWNKFAEATGASDAGFATWEGLSDVARRYYEWTDSLTEAPEDGKAFFGRDALANYLIVGSRQLGAELFQVEKGRVTLNLDPAVLRRLWDNYYVPYINGYYAAIGRFRSDDAKTGDIIALVGSTTSATYFPKEVTTADATTYSIEASVYPVPNFEGAPKYAVQQGAGMVVTKSTDKAEYATVTFLKWLTQPENNLRFSIGSGYLPVQIAANTQESMDAVIAASVEPIAPIMKRTLEVGIKTTKDHEFYTSKAFESGARAREIASTSLQEKADADRAQVLNLLAAGISRADAVAQYDTDENFLAWFDDFSDQLRASVE